jgi:hypothetical protein
MGPLAAAVPQRHSLTPSQQYQVRTTDLLRLSVLLALKDPGVTSGYKDIMIQTTLSLFRTIT